MNQCSNFLGVSFSNRDNARTPIRFRKKKDNPRILKNDFSSKADPSISTSTGPMLLDWSNKTSWVFPTILINKPLPAPVHRVSQVRFKISGQLYLLPQIRCLITLWEKSSMINIDSNITDNIIRKVINVS